MFTALKAGVKLAFIELELNNYVCNISSCMYGLCPNSTGKYIRIQYYKHGSLKTHLD